ncbi:type II CAAX endopeptidase family protein [Lentilactobacillus senioris]|uniref:CPBP family intramembrane glutamic endopeptidase n=1 Tax=Lentilactobacillus senioris TaxID=931534 RepID=UPI00227E8AC6|nr:type II CAAX endopeptidase family protein [Lentilactobacillus senioris]MCY9807107.1 type II CAAX endopeptidase family protein [Lentilactobacillus senioris]
MAKTFSFNKKLGMALVAILLIIAELFGGKTLVSLASNNLAKALVGDGIFLTVFLVLIWMYRDILKADWKLYRQHIWRNLFLALLALIITKLVLDAVRWEISQMGMAVNSGIIMPASVSVNNIQIISSLTPFLAPFSEEIVFRGTLFYQWTNSKVLGLIMFIISSIAFGLAHWNNFGGQIILMVPYMFMGAFYAFIYWRSNNIWHSIMAHILFDFPPVIMSIYTLLTI